ncbi:hypothetical protein FisN_17Lh228 [Fistulifera solaris]|uniref:Aspartyl/asparaginy/proline hydroxylase domain-containing protein n=1 Tax=Fistulifera solaris TaxID=1519565 RepID=A0A1Z5KHM3_FISSO|nr:hypothetical protein FisN_17Lh228 [Fistulifera solaris]|eukprot:GAX25813.1 hypothetical protein FisN_17Lh228 [Fistulifera solaris]
MRRRKTTSTPSYHGDEKDELKSKGSGRESRLVVYGMAFCVLYVLAPLGPHIMRALPLLLSGRKHEFSTIFRYDIPWAWAKDAHREVFPEMTPTSLGSNFDIIIQEYDAYRKLYGEATSFADIDKKYQGFKDKEPWGSQFLRVYGVDTCYADYFPKTMELFNHWEYEATSIMISRLAPGQTLPAHLGPTKLVLRHLMVLKADFEPEPSAIHIGSCYAKPQSCELKKYPWEKEGQERVFDDSFWHMADNPTHKERIALFTDVKREMKGWREQLIYDLIMYVIRVSAFEPKHSIVENTNRFCEAAKRKQSGQSS